MAAFKQGFSGFSVDDIQKAKEFYTQILGLQVEEDTAMGMLQIHLPGSEAKVMVYPKPDHAPAVYTIMNLVVEDIDTAVDDLAAKGVSFEKYGEPFKQDDKGIARSDGDPSHGPSVAWFKDPAGNIISIIQE